MKKLSWALIAFAIVMLFWPIKASQLNGYSLRTTDMTVTGVQTTKASCDNALMSFFEPGYVLPLHAGGGINVTDAYDQTHCQEAQGRFRLSAGEFLFVGWLARRSARKRAATRVLEPAAIEY